MATPIDALWELIEPHLPAPSAAVAQRVLPNEILAVPEASRMSHFSGCRISPPSTGPQAGATKTAWRHLSLEIPERIHPPPQRQLENRRFALKHEPASSRRWHSCRLDHFRPCASRRTWWSTAWAHSPRFIRPRASTRAFFPLPTAAGIAPGRLADLVAVEGDPTRDTRRGVYSRTCAVM